MSNRKQYVEINNVKSELKSVNIGVPQGSILGPLLFIIYVNDINNASKCFESILYADDTSLNSTLTILRSNRGTLSSNINRELNLINEWLLANKLSLNITKTKYMVFRYKQTPVSNIPNLELHINHSMIEKVSEFDFLGITIEETLSWKSHVSKISNKISKIVGLLSRTKRYLDTSVLIKIYNSLILSHLHYGILCWGFECSSIFKLQKKAIRTICKTKYNAHTDPLFKSLNTLKVVDIFKLQCMKFYQKYSQNNLPSYFSNMFRNAFESDTITTRAATYRRPISTNRSTTKKTLRYEIPQIIFNLPLNLKSKLSTHSLWTIKTLGKSYLLNKYPTNCTKEHCYVCDRHLNQIT